MKIELKERKGLLARLARLLKRKPAPAGVKKCCLKEANLKLLEDECRNGLTVKQCQVCGCRHRRLKLEPGVIGLRVMPLGKR